MSSLHWLIVVPYYFFLAMAYLSILMVGSRLLRIPAAINTLVGISIAVAFLDLVVLLGFVGISIRSFTLLPLLAIFAVSLAFAAIDVLLARRLPLPLDEELAALDTNK